MLTADHPVCPKLQKRISQEKSKLEGEIALSQAMDVPVSVSSYSLGIDRHSLHSEKRLSRNSPCPRRAAAVGFYTILLSRSSTPECPGLNHGCNLLSFRRE